MKNGVASYTISAEMETCPCRGLRGKAPRCFAAPPCRTLLHHVTMGLLLATPSRKWEGGDIMDGAITFLLSVAASVVGYYICKWLDEKFVGKK